MELENTVYKTFRLRKMKLKVRLASFDNRIGFIDEDAASFKRGDIICAKDKSNLARAGKRVAAWRTRLTPFDLVLLRPAEGWSQGSDFVVDPYRGMIPQFDVFPGGDEATDPPKRCLMCS